MGTDDNIIDLSEYRGREQCDLEIMLQIHDKIKALKDKGLRKKLDKAWREAAGTLFFV